MKTKGKPTGAGVDAELARDADALREALVDLVRVCGFRDRSLICCHDVSVTQCHAIDVLERRGPLSLNALAAELYLDKTTASRVVSTLERKKYVARRRSPEDARSIVLSATPAGKRLHDSIRQVLNAAAVQLLERTDPTVRTTVLDILRKLTCSIGSCCGVEKDNTAMPPADAPSCTCGGGHRRKSC